MSKEKPEVYMMSVDGQTYASALSPEEDREEMKSLCADLKGIADKLQKRYPSSDRRIALTKIKEARLWLGADIARIDKVIRGESEEE
jgi:hypothetical protein